MILFQGLDDPVVAPAQSEKIYEALQAKGVPVAYMPFEGEQHGFRQAKNSIRSLEAELYFYGKVFGFEPADEIEPVQIDNLPAQLDPLSTKTREARADKGDWQRSICHSPCIVAVFLVWAGRFWPNGSVASAAQAARPSCPSCGRRCPGCACACGCSSA